LAKVGLCAGMEVMVHSSMRCLGYVVNGALDVIDAILDIIGNDGTLLMPAHTGQLTDPVDWQQPPVPEKYVDTIRQCMRPFDPKTTPVRNRGLIAQTFLTYPYVFRSSHMLNSVAAKGKMAAFFTEVHDLHASEGMNSPIGRLYEREGYILLIGVGLNSCTAIHLAEFIMDVYYLRDSQLKVLIKADDGINKFVRLERYPSTSDFFNKLLPELRNRNMLKEVAFGSGRLSLLPVKELVELAMESLHVDQDYFLKP
ncbi:aminoglycoside N(3)-acetyltransferase, partial [Thermodesulfobacteriota bacterium]